MAAPAHQPSLKVCRPDLPYHGLAMAPLIRSAKLIVFDGDDTLWKTQELYEAIKRKFAGLMREWGLSESNPIPLLERIDSQAVESHGFTVRRFEDSMLNVYHLLSQQRGRPTREPNENLIRGLTRPLEDGYELYPDSLSVLTILCRDFKLVLATKGQSDLQNTKIERLGLSRFFSAIYVLDQKTSREYEQILEDCVTAPELACAVGNSVRSDINPATESGMSAILVRRLGWRYEREHIHHPERVWAVSSLTEAADILIEMRTRGRSPANSPDC